MVYPNQNSLWSSILTTKYISLGNLIDRSRRQSKTAQNVLNHWKDLSKAFHVINHFFSWKVGTEKSIHVGSYSIVFLASQVRLPRDIIAHLQNIAKETLDKIVDQENSNLWCQGWLSIQDLALSGNWDRCWDECMHYLHKGHI